MKTGSIRQTVWFRAPPMEIYRALMTSKGHAAFTGAPARISPRVGGRIMAWGGYIHGKNLRLTPGKRIVQSWRPTDKTWPRTYFSRVTFNLSPSRGGTTLKFAHTGVPAEHVGHLSSGWKESYWQPLTKYFRAHRKG